MDPIPSFEFRTAGQIRFGRGVSADLARQAAALGTRVLLVHGRSAARAGWALDALTAQGLAPTALACAGEPDLPLLESALESARGVRPDVVVALGGGAAIDLAKALAALLPVPGDPRDHLEVVGDGRPLDRAPLPVVAVPTTAGTGSEVTRNAVIGIPEARRKVSLRDPRILPAVALVDPALTDTLPWPVTLCSGLDAVTQVIEPFVSCRANPLTDALTRTAIPRGLAALARLAEGQDAAARDAMAWVSLSGGLALANAGLGIVHGLAGPLGGLVCVPHGEICAALLPAALAENARRTRDLPVGARFDLVFENIAGVLGGTARDAPGRLAAWSRAQGIRSLTEMGVDAALRETATEAALTASSSRGNPVPLDRPAIRRILEAAA